MGDVTDPKETVIPENQPIETPPVETETTPPSVSGEKETAETKVSTAPEIGSEKTEVSEKSESDSSTSQLENLRKALQQEREARKALQREIAQARSQRSLEGYSQEDLEQIISHPWVQELLLHQAETQLKEGAREILSQYPQIPKPIANAILRNPRGYVQPGTSDVETALLDISDYVAGIAEEFGEGGTSEPKSFPVAGTNVSAVPEEETTPAEIAALMKKPPEEWTDEELKLAEEWQTGKSK